MALSRKQAAGAWSASLQEKEKHIPSWKQGQGGQPVVIASERR